MNGKSDRDKINEVLTLLNDNPEPTRELLLQIRTLLRG